MLSRRRQLGVFVGGQSVNALGSTISSVALPLLAVERLHASTFTVGALEAVEWLPAVLISLPVGALVDRHQGHARRLMMAANLGQAAAVASVPVAAATGLLTVLVVMAAATTAGAFTVLFQAGYSPYLRAFLDSDNYLRANAQVRGGQSVAMLSGPALAGALVEAVGAAATIVADAASFLVSFLSLGVLSAPPLPSADGHGTPLRGQVKDGLAYLWRHPLLRTLAWAPAVPNLFLTAIGAVEVVFLVRQVGASPAWIGGLFAFAGAGGIAGSLLTSPLQNRFGLTRLARLSVAATAPALLLLPLTTHGAGMVLFALAGAPTSLGISVAGVSFVTLRLQHCPAELQARISTTSRAVTAATIPVGALVGGSLGELAGNRLALLLLCVAYVGSGLSLLSSGSLREPVGDGPSGRGAVGMADEGAEVPAPVR